MFRIARFFVTWNLSLKKLLKRTLLAFVYGYRMTFAALLGGQCRFHPSCSEYAVDVLHGHSTGKAVKLIMIRLMRCHPFHPGGYDPAPRRVA